MANREIVYSTCKSCHGGCGVKVTKEDGVVIHIEGNPDSLTGGTMCSKGLSSIQHIDNPYRMKYPMKQVGKKGTRQMEADLVGRGPGHHRRQDEGGHRRPGAAEHRHLAGHRARLQPLHHAAGPVARHRQRHHPWLRLPQPAPGPLRPGDRLRTPVLRLPRLGRRVPQDPDHVGQAAGDQSSADTEMCYWYMRSLDYCKNLIIIDPRASAYATRANLWIQPRPGTDCALALGMMNVIIEEELWDKEFVDKWTYGFDELRERVKEWTPAEGRPTSAGYPRSTSPRPPACGPSTRRAASRWVARWSGRPTAATPCGPSPASWAWPATSRRRAA